MYWIKENVQIVGKVDFKRFKSIAQNMSSKEFKENCPEFRKYFWRTVLAYLGRLEESFFTNFVFENYDRLPLRTSERMFIVNFLTNSLKRVGCSDVHMIVEIIGSCAEYCDLHYDSDNRVEEFISGPDLTILINDFFLSGSFDEIAYYSHELTDTYFYTFYSMDVAIESANEDFTNSLMKYGWFCRGKMSECGALVDRLVKLFVSIW